MRARIYQPARTAMQSGTAKTHDWVLEYVPASSRQIDPLMGWTSSNDMNSHYSVATPKVRKAVIRPGGYGDNFATNRRGVWTH